MPAPANFLRLQVFDFIARGYGGMGIGVIGKLTFQRLRHQRRRLCAGRERRGSGRQPKGEFQKVPAFHAISSSALW
jgi:hypothetical protein